MMNIVATTTATSPYIAARYTAFQEMNPQYNMTLVEYGYVSKEYAWSPTDGKVPYRRLVLSKKAIQNYRPYERMKMIFSALDSLCPDVMVVCGYDVPGMMDAFFWAQGLKRHNVPVVMLSDSSAQDRKRVQWKEMIKQRIIGRCSAALVAGARHRAYMHQLGMPDDRIFTGYDVVDNHYFRMKSQIARENAMFWKTKLGLPTCYFLSVARFIRQESGINRVKNLHRLLSAYSVYLQRNPDSEWGVVILGDGELRPEIEAQIADLGLSDRVILPGFKQYPELPIYYGLASVFILASIKDTWGLVVNEAMASGLPVLVSNRCGCADDLVQNGRNGYIFDPYDVDALANLMLKMSSDACDRKSMGQASQEIISRWAPETFAHGLSQAIHVAVASKRPKATFLDKALFWALCWR